MPTYRRTFPGLPEELRNARNWVRDILTGNPHVDDAALIVTELGANALLHTTSGIDDGTFRISLTLCGQEIAISVTDCGGSRAVPHVEHPSRDETHGRGLGMVTSLASRIEVHGDDHGHSVTAYLAQPSSHLECIPEIDGLSSPQVTYEEAIIPLSQD